MDELEHFVSVSLLDDSVITVSGALAIAWTEEMRRNRVLEQEQPVEGHVLGSLIAVFLNRSRTQVQTCPELVVGGPYWETGQ